MGFTSYIGTPFEPRILPIIPAGARLSPGSKIPPESLGKIPGWRGREGWYGFDWRKFSATARNLERFDSWYADRTAPTVGIDSRELLGVDVDVDHPEGAEIVRNCACELLHWAPPVRTRPNSKKLLLCFRLDLKRTTRLVTKIRRVFEDADGNRHALEVLGDGQQWLMEGEHPSGVLYAWEHNTRPVDLGWDNVPLVTADDIDAFVTEATTRLTAAGFTLVKASGLITGSGSTRSKEYEIGPDHPDTCPDLALLKQTLKLLPAYHPEFEDREDWVRMLRAVKTALAGDETGYELFEAWALPGHPENTPEMIRSIWESFNSSSLGWDYIGTLAGHYGFTGHLGFEPQPAGDDAATGRPVLRLRAGQLPQIVNEAEHHLIERDEEIFQRGGIVVRPAKARIIAADGREILGTRLVPVKIPHMRDRFGQAIEFQRFVDDKWRPTDCPRQVAELYLDREGLWRLPVLTRLVNAPTLRADGSVLAVPGYDRGTGLLFDPQGIEFPEIPTSPSRDDAIAALTVLRELIGTFPFVDEQSRAVALSAILTAIVRPSLPSAPLHAYTAPVAGSGKSMLVDIVSMIAMGRETAVLAQGKTEEEFEKRLGAAFIAGDATISIDNCEQPLGGEFICQVLTQLSVKIRLLGHSKNIEVPTNTCLFATGNNLRLIGDITRRAIVCSLDPEHERPETREFAVNPVEEARKHRARYVAAALTILRAFHVAGRPLQRGPLGSFEVWSRLVRDALIWLDEADPCATMERAREEDPQLQKLRTVLHAWRKTIGERRLSAAEMVDAAEAIGGQGREFRDGLLSVASNGYSVDVRRLGSWLGRNQSRIVDGLKIERHLVHGVSQWQLVGEAATTSQRCAKPSKS